LAIPIDVLAPRFGAETMRRLTTILIVALSCLVVLVLFAGSFVIATADVSTSSSSTLKSGRTVTATYHGWTGIGAADSDDSTTLEMAGHQIVVAPSKLIVDGRTIATIDVNAKTVAVDGDRHAIRIVADGKPIATISR
jgi:hypothetical protein